MKKKVEADEMNVVIKPSNIFQKDQRSRQQNKYSYDRREDSAKNQYLYCNLLLKFFEII